MQNFENKLAMTEKTLENVRGIFEKHQVEKTFRIRKLLCRRVFER